MNAIFNFVKELVQNPVQTVVRAVTQFVSNPVGTIIGVAKDIFAPQGGGSNASAGSSQSSGGSRRSSNRDDDADQRGADEARRREARERAAAARRTREELIDRDLSQIELPNLETFDSSMDVPRLPFDLLVDIISHPGPLTLSLAQMMRHEPETLEFIGTHAPSLEAALNLLFVDAGRDDEDDMAGVRLLDTFLQKRLLREVSTPSNLTVELPTAQTSKSDFSIEFLPPAASRLAGQVPNSFLPWISAVDFGLRGLGRSLSQSDSKASPLGLAFQEAIGGFNYGLGTARYIRERGLTAPANHQPSEGEIALAAMIAYHEGSENQFGSAFEMMAARALYNRVELLNPVFATSDRLDLYLRPGDHVNSGSWSGVFYTFLNGQKPDSWDAVASISNTMLGQPDVYPGFAESLALARVAAEVFNLGLPDPVNRGVFLDSNPAPGIGEFGRHYPPNFRVGSDLVQSGYETTPLSFMRGIVNTITLMNLYYKYNEVLYGTHGVFLRINPNGAVESVNWNWRQSPYIP